MLVCQKVKIKDYCEITSSKRVFASEYASSGVPFYRGKEISKKQMSSAEINDTIYITRAKFEEIKAKYGVPQPGDILLTSVGTIGNPYLVKDMEEFYFKDGNLTWFRNFNGINPKWLYYWLLSKQGKAELKKCIIGSSQKAYTINLLYNLEIDLPDFSFQSTLASTLSAYDKLIENNEKRIKILEEMAEFLYQEWFVKFKFPGYKYVKTVDSRSEYGLIPEGWRLKSLKELTLYLSRGISPIYDDLGPTKVINQKCIRNSKVDLDVARRQNKNIPLEKKLCFGDILINSTGVGTLGRVAQIYEVMENITVDTHVTIVRPYLEEYVDYLGLFALQYQNSFERLGIGATGQTELSREAIGNVKIVAPSLDIMSSFNKAVRSSRLEVVSLQNKNKILSKIRGILIPQLITGHREIKS